jgi:hypothetical protein
VRGLPPLPPDVVEIIATWDVNGQLVTTRWSVFAPGADGATAGQLNTLLGDFFFSPAHDAIDLLSSDTSLVQLQCVTGPANGLIVTLTPAPNVGPLDGSTALNAALVWTFKTGEHRVGSHMHVWLPLSRSNLGADKRRLSPLGFTEAAARALDFMQHVNATASPDGAACVLVAVHKQRAGVPLAHAEFSPVVFATASPIVGTLQRRVRSAPRSPSHI